MSTLDFDLAGFDVPHPYEFPLRLRHFWFPEVSTWTKRGSSPGFRIARWAAEFNAETDWLLTEVLRTLRGWYVAADWRRSLKWITIHGRSDLFVVGDPFEFRWAGWEMQLLTWSHSTESVRGRFETALSEYEKRARELATSRGLVRAQRKYSPENLVVCGGRKTMIQLCL